jgi:hypothetical protein
MIADGIPDEDRPPGQERCQRDDANYEDKVMCVFSYKFEHLTSKASMNRDYIITQASVLLTG